MTHAFKSQGAQKPTAFGSLLQNSAYGSAIPVIYGQTQSVLLAIWAANLRQGGGGLKKFKQMLKGITNYCENIDFLLGHNPIRGVLQVSNNGTNFPLNFTSQSFSGAGGRQSFTVTDSHFYFVIGVSLAASYSFDVDDYGGSGPETLSGTWQVPLWNELETGPDPTDPTSYRAWPYCFRWQPGMGATVDIDSESFPAGEVTVYYAQLMDATSYQPPITKLYMSFEPQLGSGDEYANANQSEQQIVYPHFAGLESSEIDLGSSGALPQLNPEVAGKWSVYSTGDGDFVDMIEDICKSGLAQAAITAETSTQPEPAATQMERGLSSYDLPGTIQKKIDASFTVALPPMQYDMPNAAGNVLIVVATGSGTLGISSSNGESWTAIYESGLGYQVWYAKAAGGPNVVTVSGASAPWQMSILEVGGVGAAIPQQVLVTATGNSNASTEGGTNTASAVSTNTTCTLTAAGNEPPFNLGSACSAEATFTGFALPSLPAGATITAIQPVVEYTSSFAASLPADFTFLAVNSLPAGIGFPSLGTSGTWTGPSIGTAIGDYTSIKFSFQQSSQFNNFAASLQITSIGLLVSYTLPAGEGLGGDTVDDVVTAAGGSPATVVSSVMQGLPAYLLAISLYPGGSATAAADELLWRAVTPGNFAGNSPGTFQMQERIVASPGSYVAQGAGGAPASICVIALKAVNPPPNPKPLGDFVDLPSFDLVRAQCRANGLWGSLAMTSQSAASDWIKTLCQAANAAPVFLGRKLFLYPYSEASAAGNGATYTAPTAAGPVAELDAAFGDFVGTDGCPKLTTVDRIGLPNVLQMQIVDRNDNYNQVVVQVPDVASIALYGQRKADAVVNGAVQDPAIARTLLGIQVRRNQYGGDVWEFTASARWSLLSPMDLITLTDELQGITGAAVRITAFNENDDGSFAGTAEPFVYGMCAPNALSATAVTPNPSGTQQSAGDANAPIIFEPTPALYPGRSGDEIWVVVSSDNENFGGAQVFLSTDGGDSYNPAPGGADGNTNIVVGSAVTGSLTADWPAANDPDTTNNLSVDLTESDGALESYSTLVEDNFEVPCFVASDGLVEQENGVDIASGDPLIVDQGGSLIAAIGTEEQGGTAIAEAGGDGFGYELMSYAVATLTAAYKYTLQATGAGNSLRRSILDAPSSSGVGVDHATGSRFAVVGPGSAGILKMTIPPQYIGQQLYFKICTFNTFGAALQSLADVSAYSYVPTGVPGGA